MNAPNPAVNQAPSELRAAVAALRPYFVRVGWFSLPSSLLVLAPSGYMLEVYGRVVNSRSHTTLAMLTLLILGVYVVMELLEWARSEVMRAASVELDERMRSRIFHAIFDANLRRIPGGTQQPLNDFRQIREFLYSPVLLGLMESPVSVVMLVLLFLINPVLGWTSIAFACVITLVAWLNERATKPPLMQANRSAIAAQQYADGSLRNAQVIESMGMLRDIHARWMAKQREFLNLQARASEAAGGYQAVSKFLQTTLARLLMGLWPSMVGKVRLDGADVFTWDKSELGAHVGYLPQGVELFDGTVAENIARFGEVDPSKVEAAARAVGLHEFIMALPQGYDSPVGRDGAMLSGGQRQRVGLARAIYGDPVFVVLDEPNSSLDEEGDAALANAIRLMKSRGTTFVVMTHRTSVLAVADKMLVLRDGQTQAFGPRDEVLAALQKAAQQQAQQQVAQQALGTA